VRLCNTEPPCTSAYVGHPITCLVRRTDVVAWGLLSDLTKLFRKATFHKCPSKLSPDWGPRSVEGQCRNFLPTGEAYAKHTFPCVAFPMKACRVTTGLIGGHHAPSDLERSSGTISRRMGRARRSRRREGRTGQLEGLAAQEASGPCLFRS